MYLFCPKCQSQHPATGRCPRCSSRLLSPGEAADVLTKPAAGPPAPSTPTCVGRAVVGTVLALGAYLGLREWTTATLEAAGIPATAEALLWAAFGLRAVSTAFGGLLAGSGRSSGFPVGLVVGAAGGVAWLAVDAFPNPPVDPLHFGLAAVLTAAGGVAAFIGSRVWPQAVKLAVPTSPRNSSLFRLKPETAAARRGRPTSWARVLVGATVAVGGVAVADTVRGSLGRSPGLTGLGGPAVVGLVDFEMGLVALLLGGVLAGTGTGAGLRHGLIAGAVAALGVLALHAVSADGLPAVDFVADKLGVAGSPTTAATVVGGAVFGVVTAFGWMGGQLLPPVVPGGPRRRALD